MDGEALNNNAVQPPSMAWTPRITISRGSQLPKIRNGNAAMASAFEHAHRPNSSAAPSLDPQSGLRQSAHSLDGAGSVVHVAGQPLPLLPQAHRTETQHAGVLPPVVQLQSFQSLRAGSLGSDQYCPSPMPHWRATSEDTFGVLPSRNLGLPSASPSFLGAAAQLLQSPPASSAAARGPNSQPEAAMPQYRVQREGQWPCMVLRSFCAVPRL
jgi:hypothetical protein